MISLNYGIISDVYRTRHDKLRFLTSNYSQINLLIYAITHHPFKYFGPNMEYHLLPRLFVSSQLQAGLLSPFNEKQIHYITHVMRMSVGDSIRIFNGHNGEWIGQIQTITKRSINVEVRTQLRAQKSEPDLRLYCAPIKKSHFDYMIEKAAELGVTSLHPILTSRTQIREVNIERCQTLAIEAAEQSERLNILSFEHASTLQKVIEKWPVDCTPIICAEWGKAMSAYDVFLSLASQTKIAIFVGPEGGFASEELALLRTLTQAHFVRLGPRILRADTAAIAALSCWQAFCGDWRNVEEHC